MTNTMKIVAFTFTHGHFQFVRSHVRKIISTFPGAKVYVAKNEQELLKLLPEADILVDRKIY